MPPDSKDKNKKQNPGTKGPGRVRELQHDHTGQKGRVSQTNISSGNQSQISQIDSQDGNHLPQHPQMNLNTQDRNQQPLHSGHYSINNLQQPHCYSNSYQSCDIGMLNVPNGSNFNPALGVPGSHLVLNEKSVCPSQSLTQPYGTVNECDRK